MRYAVDRIQHEQPGLAAVFAARVAEHRAPASAYAVVHEGRMLAFGAFADAQVTPQPTADTAFRIASCTKSFTAATLLAARDDGLLELEAPVTEYLGARFVGPGGAPTLAQLASMSGGLPTDDPWGDRQESLTPDRFDALCADGLRLIHAPGTAYEYSNLGFALLGRVLERVTGRAYPVLVRERILDPLGITEGLGYDSGVRADAVAQGFARFDDAWQAQPFSGPGAFSAIGGMFATPRALARWIGWLADAHRPGAADGPLSAASRRQLQSPRIAVRHGVHYGLGLVIERDARHGTIVSHSGGYPGYGANMRWHVASGVGVLVLENARYSGATAPATRALVEVLDTIAIPETLDLWPETAAARDTVERLLRGWDTDAALAILAENVELDEPLHRRRSHIAALTGQVGIHTQTPTLDLGDTAARSDSPAHLVWTVPGSHGTLRCEIRMTPEALPRVQTLVVRVA